MNSETNFSQWKDQFGVTHSGELLNDVNGFKVIRCEHCGFVHVTPIPTKEDLKETYTHEYYSSEKPLYIERYLQDKDWWDATYSARYEIYEKNLEPLQRSVLDIGSGPGLFLAVGKERGWKTKGVEISQIAANYAREELKLDIEEIFLTEETFGRLGKFDVVNMSLVLEHIPNPASMLKIAHSMLNDGAIISIVVPNDYNPFQDILAKSVGYNPWWVAPPHHLNYFDFPSLEKLMESCGFKTIHKEVTFPIDLFLLMGKNYIGNDSLGRECHGLRKQFEMNLINSGNGDLLSKVYQSFAEIGIGRELVYIGKKI